MKRHNHLLLYNLINLLLARLKVFLTSGETILRALYKKIIDETCNRTGRSVAIKSSYFYSEDIYYFLSFHNGCFQKCPLLISFNFFLFSLPGSLRCLRC